MKISMSVRWAATNECSSFQHDTYSLLMTDGVDQCYILRHPKGLNRTGNGLTPKNTGNRHERTRIWELFDIHSNFMCPEINTFTHAFMLSQTPTHTHKYIQTRIMHKTYTEIPIDMQKSYCTYTHAHSTGNQKENY